MDNRIVYHKLHLLQSMAADDTHIILGWRARTADNPSPGEYIYDSDWVDVELPAMFKAGKTVFLRANVDLPVSTTLDRTYLAFDFELMEGLLRIDGLAYAGIDANHVRALPGKGGKFAIELEFHSVPEALCFPEKSSLLGLFRGGSVQVINRDIEGLAYDIKFATEAAQVVADTRRKKLIELAIESSVLAFDLTLPRAAFLDEVKTARSILSEKLAAIEPDPGSGSLFAVGHSHIDTAWLWPVRETVRKCGRTFSTACRLMERYPEFYFSCSQPQLYQYTKEHFPEVYSQMKKWIAAGRWDTTGAMWIEADCNITSGESLIRQMLLGLAFYKEEFGTSTNICWLPDVFGYPCSLPEILLGCGIKYFYTYKLHWQASNPFPDHLFNWRGLDGSEILAAVVNNLGAYNNFPNPEYLAVSWERYNQKAEYPEIIFPYGFGDGGGGVTEEMLEFVERAQQPYPGLPSVRTSSPETFFDDVVNANPQLPVWDGELYVQTHRGTYTTQSALKKANRTSELLLRDTEIWGALAQQVGVDFDTEKTRQAWRLLLLNQFHDILPGSSIGMVYEDAHRDHRRIHETAEPALAAALAVFAPETSSDKTIRVFNSLSWVRRDAFTFKQKQSKIKSYEVVDSNGRRTPAQTVSSTSEGNIVVVDGLEVPSVGFADFVIEEAVVAHTLSITTSTMDTPHYQLSLTADGGISRLFDKEHSREVISVGGVGNDLQLFQDGPEFEDAWNVHATVGKRRYPFDPATSISVIESGPVRGIVRVIKRHRDTVIEQDIIVYAASRRIDFVTRVDWKERHTMLKVAFPLAIRSLWATYEVQFGAIERPTHRNTSWEQQKFEVPAQRWADISEPGYGVSLLNNSRYGYDALENVLRLSLLRGATWPDPLADLGHHEFTYSLLPHAGQWFEADTVHQAWQLNVPQHVRSVQTIARPKSFIILAGADVIMESLKPAEDGRGLILRLYEPHGARGHVTVKTDSLCSSVVECNHVEVDFAEIPVENSTFEFEVTPFQIRSFRLLKAS